jgi:hypothetical protein
MPLRRALWSCGTPGNDINTPLRAAAMNFHKLLVFLCRLLKILRPLFAPASRAQFWAVTW